MSLCTFGINHQTAPIEIRERLAFSAEQMPLALKQLISTATIDEAVILSTCNRTEIYTTTNSQHLLKQWLMQQHQLHDIDITPFCYYHQGVHAIRHLMRVASGLDSMIMGEPQILGQIKTAYATACEAGSIGDHLQSLFPAVFATTKHVRSATNIGKCPVSVAYAVVKLCQQVFTDLRHCNVLLVGAGTTIELVATHLDKNDVKHMMIANRHIEHAAELAEQFNATPIRIGDIPQQLDKVDIIISATASQLPILGKGLFERLQRHTAARPLFIADLAMPRDVEPEVADLANIHLYNLDDLRNVINHNLKNRLSAAEQAESMIEMYAANYMRQLRIHDAGDIIRQYRNTINQQRDCELAKAMTQLKAGKQPEAVLKNFARNFGNKVMHDPTMKLRDAALNGDLNYLTFAKKLFKD